MKGFGEEGTDKQFKTLFFYSVGFIVLLRRYSGFFFSGAANRLGATLASTGQSMSVSNVWKTEEEVGRQDQGMDRPGVRQVPQGSGEQGKMEETGCEVICDAPATLAIKG